jgi:hypothetical protein
MGSDVTQPNIANMADEPEPKRVCRDGVATAAIRRQFSLIGDQLRDVRLATVAFNVANDDCEEAPGDAEFCVRADDAEKALKTLQDKFDEVIGTATEQVVATERHLQSQVLSAASNGIESPREHTVEDACLDLSIPLMVAAALYTQSLVTLRSIERERLE